MSRIGFASVLIVGVGFGGCSQPAPQTEQASTSASTSVSSDHGHGHDGHSHDGHIHGAGPHGGTIVDWGGGKYHVEFTVDHEQQQATVYILGRDEKTPTPIDTQSLELSIKDPEMLVTLQALPQENDADGKASRFIGTHEKLGVVQEYAGTLTGVVDGTPYSGDFQEEAQ